jgi:hypothetical protein
MSGGLMVLLTWQLWEEFGAGLESASPRTLYAVCCVCLQLVALAGPLWVALVPPHTSRWHTASTCTAPPHSMAAAGTHNVQLSTHVTHYLACLHNPFASTTARIIAP